MQRINRFGRIAFSSLIALGAALTLTAHAFAGAVGGPLFGSDRVVYAESKNCYDIAFKGGERATISADGNGDIDIFVYDSNGRLVTSDDDEDGIPLVTFTPSRTQTYHVEVENCEDYAVTYDIETN